MNFNPGPIGVPESGISSFLVAAGANALKIIQEIPAKDKIDWKAAELVNKCVREPAPGGLQLPGAPGPGGGPCVQHAYELTKWIKEAKKAGLLSNVEVELIIVYINKTVDESVKMPDGFIHVSTCGVIDGKNYKATSHVITQVTIKDPKTGAKVVMLYDAGTPAEKFANLGNEKGGGALLALYGGVGQPLAE